MKPGGRPVHEPALGLWTMIAIAVGVVVVIAVVIDVSCYFMSGCGVTMCICVRLCDRQAPGDADDTAELKETNNKNNDVEATPVQPVLQAPADDRYFLASVADYPLGRIGSCLRPARHGVGARPVHCEFFRRDHDVQRSGTTQSPDHSTR